MASIAFMASTAFMASLASIKLGSYIVVQLPINAFARQMYGILCY